MKAEEEQPDGAADETNAAQEPDGIQKILDDKNDHYVD